MGGFFDAPAKQAELDRLERIVSEPGFWDDQEAAQNTLKQRSRLERALEQQRNFDTAVSDAEVLFEFALEDADSAAELETLIVKLEKDVDAAQTRMVAVAKELSAKGEIVLSDGKSDDELIY